jgi:hypothetical protein
MRTIMGLSLALCLLPAAAQAQVSSFNQASMLPQTDNNAQRYWADYPTRVQPVGYSTNAGGVPQTDNAALAAEATPGVADCGCSDTGCCLQCDKWFGSVAGLVLGRNNPNAFWTTYESNNNPNQVMNTVDSKADWNYGSEFRFGFWFDCGPLASSCCNARNGLEVVYFFVTPMDGFSSVRGDQFPAGTVSTTIDLQDPTTPSGNVEIGGTDSAQYFDGATEQRIYRKDEVQDIELNFLHEQLRGTDAFHVTWFGGVRYFRFTEGLIYGSVGNGAEFGDNGGADEAYLNIHCTNNLFGPQIGLRADYALTERFGLYAAPVMGIFANQINTRSHLYTGNGLEGYDIHGQTENFSFLAQLDVGVNYQFTDHWRAFLGYRLIAATGIAMSDNQIPHYLAATDELAQPDVNGDLILHGGVAGLEFRY